MTKYRLLLLFILATFTIVFSQHRGGGMGGSMPAIGKISGTVVDSLSGAKIEYANISLISMRKDEIVDGGVTDVDGQFNLRELKLGRYKLIIEFIGFSQKIIEPINLFPGEGGGIEQDLGVIELSPSSLMLDAVQVIDEEPMYINEIDKKVFNVAQSSTVTGGTAEDALNNIPNVDVDIDGKITLRGDANVTILINGKPSVLSKGGIRTSAVGNLPADMIEKIEVITSPSAKYDPDGMAGIINIILKKGMFEGFNGSLSSTFGERDKTTFSTNLNYFVDKFNIFANYSYKDEKRFGEAGREYQRKYDEDTVFVDYSSQYSDFNKHNIGHTFSFGSDYYLNDKNSFTLSASFNTYEDSSQWTTKYFEDFDVETNLFNTEDDSTFLAVDAGGSNDFMLGYYKDFENIERKLSAELQHSNSSLTENQFKIIDNDSLDSTAFNEEEQSKTTFQVDYVHPFVDNNKLEFGLKSTMTQFNSDYDAGAFPYLLDYKENIHALYTLATFYFNDKIGIMSGLRSEIADMNMQLNSDNFPNEWNNPNSAMNILDSLTFVGIKDSPYIPAKYTKFFPSFHFLYNLTDKEAIKVGYSYRTERPRLHSLNPTPRSQSIDYIRIGNPNLRPEYAEKVEIDYSYQNGMKSFSVATYYSELTDVIQWWDSDYVQFEDEDYFVMQPDNVGSSQRYGLELMASFKPLPFWFMMVSTNAWYSKLQDESGEEDLQGVTSGAFSFMMNKFFLPYIGQLELTGRMFGPLKTSIGYNTPRVMASLAVKRSFFEERLDVSFKIKNLFDNAGFELDEFEDMVEVIETTTIPFEQHQHFWHFREGRTFYLTLKYNFGELKEKKRRQKKWDRGSSEGGGMGMDF